MIDLSEIQGRFNRVSCPSCGLPELDVRLRCDLGLGECLATAACRSCGGSYMVSTERGVIEEGRRALADSVCPRCRAGGIEPAFRCELASGQCFYVARCGLCGESFRPDAATDVSGLA